MTKERRGWVLAGVVLVAVALLGAAAGVPQGTTSRLENDHAKPAWATQAALRMAGIQMEMP